MAQLNRSRGMAEFEEAGHAARLRRERIHREIIKRAPSRMRNVIGTPADRLVVEGIHQVKDQR